METRLLKVFGRVAPIDQTSDRRETRIYSISFQGYCQALDIEAAQEKLAPHSRAKCCDEFLTTLEQMHEHDEAVHPELVNSTTKKLNRCRKCGKEHETKAKGGEHERVCRVKYVNALEHASA